MHGFSFFSMCCAMIAKKIFRMAGNRKYYAQEWTSDLTTGLLRPYLGHIMRNIACTIICCCCFFNGLCHNCQKKYTNGRQSYYAQVCQVIQLSNNWSFTVTNGLQNSQFRVHICCNMLYHDCNEYMRIAYWNYVADTYWRQLLRPTRFSP